MRRGEQSTSAFRLVGPMLITFVTGMAISHRAEARARDSKNRAADSSSETVRLPYSREKVYRIRLIPGAPFALELPAGESAKNLWYDNRWWAAETTPGGARVFIRALGSSDVVGRTGLLHIETDPSDLRLSMRLEAVDEESTVPAAMEIYTEGSVLNDPARRQMQKSFDRDLVYAQKQAEERARAEFESWRKGALTNLRGDEAYDRGGDFRITRVVDDRVQTFVSIPNATDRAVIQFVDKPGRAELVNYEVENGTYVIQNKVLRPGEKFRLILGKEQGWVALK
jgi:hypothetical protein